MYKITYSNGFIQYKQLVTQQYYETEYIPLKVVIGMYEELKPNKSKKEELEKWKYRSNDLNRKMKELFPYDFFTTESPLAKSIKTGILTLPKTQGGCYLVKIEKI
jgi:hypothetical protein